MGENYETVKLSYTIHSYSSYSANYVPENIMVNKPTEQLSRWFTDSNTPAQFIMLKLKSPAIVETVTFGKFIKAHVSDLKKFQIFGGTDDMNLSLLLSAGLKNDSASETFCLRHRSAEGLYLPVQYIKIVPLQSWGPAYNYTIWYIELHGKEQEELIRSVMDTMDLRKEEEAVRIVLKHLRRRHYKQAFEALSRESGVQLEGPLQARLWTALVENGDYEKVEEILKEALAEGEFEWYLSWQPYTARWRQISACSARVQERLSCSDAALPAAAPRRNELPCADREPRVDCGEPVFTNGYSPSATETTECESSACCKPGPRGGHQLVVDSTTGTLYLFGGWNGTEDLDDLWSFDTKSERWSLLCAHSGIAGPGPRSCHKMVYDPIGKKLYTLGRYLDNAQRIPEKMKSDLYAFDTVCNEWSMLCADTAGAGGPRLVFDHQMCIDVDARTIYVFGGRVLPLNTEEATTPQYSGLFAYYMNDNTWQALESEALKPRVGHSMLFHPNQRRLYIFAGQRNKEQLVEMCWYCVDSHEWGHATPASPAPAPAPAPGVTQRAVLHPATDTVRVLSGMSKEKERGVHNTLWVFSLRGGAASCAWRARSAGTPGTPGSTPGTPGTTPGSSVTPAPATRFAHQFVLDTETDIHYLFGGNPGIPSSPRLRLDDLWSLRLERPSAEAILNEAIASVRIARYRQLATDGLTDQGQAKKALEYLRKEVYEVLDHSDPEQAERFQKLATVLFSGDEKVEENCTRLDPTWSVELERRVERQAEPAALLSTHLAQVLGAEEAAAPSPTAAAASWCAGSRRRAVDADAWEHGRAPERPPAQWRQRALRAKLHDALARYFPAADAAPSADLTHLVQL